MWVLLEMQMVIGMRLGLCMRLSMLSIYTIRQQKKTNLGFARGACGGDWYAGEEHEDGFVGLGRGIRMTLWGRLINIHYSAVEAIFYMYLRSVSNRRFGVRRRSSKIKKLKINLLRILRDRFICAKFLASYSKN